VSERLRDAPPRIDEPEGEKDVPRERSPAALLELIGEAQLADDKKTKKRLADEINEILIAMREPGNEAAETRTILTQLDLKTLDLLEDSKGRLCHTEAMETLLAAGFPHALGVKPADLEFHNVEKKRSDLEQKGNKITRWIPMSLQILVPLLGIAGVFGTHKGAIGAGIWGVAGVGMTAWWIYIRRKKKKPDPDPNA
jgi:hypothetical protein